MELEEVILEEYKWVFEDRKGEDVGRYENYLERVKFVDYILVLV